MCAVLYVSLMFNIRNQRRMEERTEGKELWGKWIVYFFLTPKNYLFWRGKKAERHTERTLILWFTSQIPVTAVAGLGQSQELGTQSSFPIWLARTQLLEPVLLLPRICSSRSWSPESDIPIKQEADALSTRLSICPECLISNCMYNLKNLTCLTTEIKKDPKSYLLLITSIFLSFG